MLVWTSSDFTFSKFKRKILKETYTLFKETG